MAARFAALAALYLVFAGQVGLEEGAVALLGGAAAAGFGLLLRREAPLRFEFRAPWARVLGGAAKGLPRETGLVAAALLRAVREGGARDAGAVRQPFDRGGDQPSEAARRGVVVLALSVAPNGYVLDPGAGGDALPVHRLARRQPASPERRWPP